MSLVEIYTVSMVRADRVSDIIANQYALAAMQMNLLARRAGSVLAMMAAWKILGLIVNKRNVT